LLIDCAHGPFASPLPEGITRSISHGRYGEAADALRTLVHLRQKGARQTSIAYAENRGLVFRGSIFHQTAALRFAEGFENRRRNVTMLFRRTQS
jgi:hypothetical protein